MSWQDWQSIRTVNCGVFVYVCVWTASESLSLKEEWYRKSAHSRCTERVWKAICPSKHAFIKFTYFQAPLRLRAPVIDTLIQTHRISRSSCCCLKGQFTYKWKFSHHLFVLILFQCFESQKMIFSRVVGPYSREMISLDLLNVYELYLFNIKQVDNIILVWPYSEWSVSYETLKISWFVFIWRQQSHLGFEQQSK